MGLSRGSNETGQAQTACGGHCQWGGTCCCFHTARHLARHGNMHGWHVLFLTHSRTIYGAAGCRALIYTCGNRQSMHARWLPSWECHSREELLTTSICQHTLPLPSGSEGDPPPPPPPPTPATPGRKVRQPRSLELRLLSTSQSSCGPRSP